MFNPKFFKINRDDNYNFNRSKFLRLDANERVINFSDRDLSNIKKLITNYNIQSYPTQRNDTLKLISKIYNINYNLICLSPGADSVLKYIFEILSFKKNILSLYPTYGMIDVYAKIYDKKIIKINQEILNRGVKKKIYKNLSLIYLAVPNMPSGDVLGRDQLINILNNAKEKKVPVIIDEAYINYSSTDTFLKLIKQYENLIIIKTFSKYFGLAGLRIGFFASSKKNIKLINSVRPPHDISLLSIKILNYFLQNYKNLSYLKKITKTKKYILNFCKKKKINIKMTDANFFHIFVDPKKVNKIVKFLKKKKILVKSSKSIDRGSPYTGPKNTIRVTLGDTKQIKIFFKNFLKILE